MFLRPTTPENFIFLQSEEYFAFHIAAKNYLKASIGVGGNSLSGVNKADTS